MSSFGYFKSFDGTRLYYSSQGEGSPLIFCYGLVCSKLHWSYQMEYFKKNHQVIWMDYRGHHNSDTPKNLESLTIANFAKDVLSLMDELGIKSAPVLGHSMGVNVALDVYRQAPDRVDSLVLANGAARNPMEMLFGINVLDYFVPALRKLHSVAPWLADKLWRSQADSKLTHAIITWGGFNPAVAKPEDIATYIRMMCEIDLEVALSLIKNFERYDAIPWIHKVHVPTLIIAGENDKVIPKDSQELMKQLIPNSKLEVIRNGSHCPQMDIPELVNIIIERFLEHNNKKKTTSSNQSTRIEI